MFQQPDTDQDNITCHNHVIAGLITKLNEIYLNLSVHMKSVCFDSDSGHETWRFRCHICDNDAAEVAGTIWIFCMSSHVLVMYLQFANLKSYFEKDKMNHISSIK